MVKRGHGTYTCLFVTLQYTDLPSTSIGRVKEVDHPADASQVASVCCPLQSIRHPLGDPLNSSGDDMVALLLTKPIKNYVQGILYETQLPESVAVFLATLASILASRTPEHAELATSRRVMLSPLHW